jgi:hypothetical protein
VLFNLIFLGLFFAGWLVCAYLPWLALSVATRGNAGLKMLPLCLFSGVVAALAVPLLGLDDGTGVWVSFVSALVAPALLLAARRFRVTAAPHHPARPDSELENTTPEVV